MADIERLAGNLMKKVNKAVYRYGMIADGDRIAVALSGGKDSFGLLEILRYRQRFVPEKYSVAAIHVIGDARGPDIPPPTELRKWLDDRGIEHLIRPTYLAENESLPMSCERCTWNRRRTLFTMAKELGCNKIAFGHHLDDLAETALMNLIFHGRNETMSPTADYFGELTLIRPLMLVPERELVRFAAANGFPNPPDPCPIGCHTRRQWAKDLIAEMRRSCPKVTSNLVRAALRGSAWESNPQATIEREAS